MTLWHIQWEVMNDIGILDIKGGDTLNWKFDYCFDSQMKPTKSFVAMQGGTYSGKTFNEMLSYAILAGIYKRTVFTVAGKYLTLLKNGALRDLKEIFELYPHIGDMFLENKSSLEYRHKKTGSVIEFRSYETRNDAKSGKRGFLFANECQGLNWEVFKELKMRTDYQTVIDFNPTSPFWFQDEFVKLWKDEDERKRMAWFISNYKNNPFIGKDKILEIENLEKEDKQLWTVYGLGKWGKLEGVVFPNVVKVSEFPSGAKNVGYGLDFGFANNPSALVKCGIWNGNMYGKEVFCQNRLFDADIENKMIEAGVIKSEAEIIADPANPQSIAYLRQRGWNIKGAIKGQGSVNFGISLLRSFKQICITDDSANWKKEATSYIWKEKDGVKTNEPVKAFDHCWDGARYWASEFIGRGDGDGYA